MKKLITLPLFLLFASITFSQNYEVFDVSSNLGVYSVVPSNLDAGRTEINYNFNVFTNDPDGMRVFITPFSKGSACADCETIVGAPLIGSGNSFLTLKFFIEGGEGHIDEIRVKITGVTLNDIKREFSIPVSIFYGEDFPAFYDFYPYNTGQVPYQCLIGEDKVFMSYEYETGNEDLGHKMTATPMTNGAFSPFYLIDKGSREPEADNIEACSFFIGGGKYVHVDSIEVNITDYEENKNYGSFVIPADISFGKVIIDGFSFEDIENYLGFGDYFQVDFSTKVKQNYASNYWVYFDPLMGDSVIEECYGNDPGIFSNMDPEGAAEFTVDDTYTYADGFRLQVLDDAGDHVLGQFKFQGVFNNFRVVYAPIDLQVLETSPVDRSISRPGDAMFCNVSLQSTEANEVYVRLTPYNFNGPIEGLEPILSEDIELGFGNEIVSLSGPVGIPCHINYYLIEVLDAGTNEILLSYKRKVDKKYEVLLTTDVEDIAFSDLDFNVYPNPSTGKVFIDLQNTSGDAIVSVYNTLGQIVYESEEDLQDDFLAIDLVGKGIYKLVVRTSTELGVKTVLIQ
jgi:hypothetical protein